MARTTKNTCKAIMRTLQGKGLGFGCTRHELMDAIINVAGSTRETREKYMAELKRHRFVKQSSPKTFTLNYEAVDEDDDIKLIGDLTIRVDVIDKELKDLTAFVKGDPNDS